MKKITKATFKSFIRKNAGKLFIQHESSFDGMSDMVEYIPSNQRKFIVLEKKTISDMDYRRAEENGTNRERYEDCVFNSENTLGYNGIWLVDHAGNRFAHFEDENFIGIDVYNCCGSFIIATPKLSRND